MLQNSAPQDATVQTEAMSSELKDLVLAVHALPVEYRDQLRDRVERVVEASTRRRRILSLVQEALSQLRLDMKYLIFDLEATRRERDALRAELDERG